MLNACATLSIVARMFAYPKVRKEEVSRTAPRRTQRPKMDMRSVPEGFEEPSLRALRPYKASLSQA